MQCGDNICRERTSLAKCTHDYQCATNSCDARIGKCKDQMGWGDSMQAWMTPAPRKKKYKLPPALQKVVQDMKIEAQIHELEKTLTSMPETMQNTSSMTIIEMAQSVLEAAVPELVSVDALAHLAVLLGAKTTSCCVKSYTEDIKCACTLKLVRDIIAKTPRKKEEIFYFLRRRLDKAKSKFEKEHRNDTSRSWWPWVLGAVAVGTILLLASSHGTPHQLGQPQLVTVGFDLGLDSMVPNPSLPMPPLPLPPPMSLSAAEKSIYRAAQHMGDMDTSAMSQGDFSDAYSQLTPGDQNFCSSAAGGGICSGNKGVPRRFMPQIRDQGDFLDALDANGIEHQYKEVRVGDLKNIQSDIKNKKIFKCVGVGCNAATCSVGNKACAPIPHDPTLWEPVLVSNDGYVIDGHHRKARVQLYNPDELVDVLEVDMAAEDIMEEIHKPEYGVEYEV